MKQVLMWLGVALILAGIVGIVASRRHGANPDQVNISGAPTAYRGIVLGPGILAAATDRHRPLIDQIAGVGANWIEVPVELGEVSPADAAGLADLLAAAHAHAVKVCLVLRLPEAERPALPAKEAQQDQWIADVWRPRVLAALQNSAVANVDLLCLGERLPGVQERGNAWTALIADVRKMYTGPLTYIADSASYTYITWWDALDFMAVTGDFPLSDKTNPTLAVLQLSWNANMDSLDTFNSVSKKHVLLMDVGYSANPQVASDPTLPNGLDPLRKDIQTLCYQTALQGAKGRPWLAGIFVKTWPIDNALTQDSLHDPALQDLLRQEWRVPGSALPR